MTNVLCIQNIYIIDILLGRPIITIFNYIQLGFQGSENILKIVVSGTCLNEAIFNKQSIFFKRVGF